MLGTVAMAGVLALCGGDDQGVKGGGWEASIGQNAPDFTLQDLDGKDWQLSAHRGSVVVLEWFNPTCPFVQKAHGDGGSLASLGNEAAGKGLHWVAINSSAPDDSGSREANLAGAAELGIEYPVLLDRSGWVGARYGAKTTPHLFVIDAQGKLVYDGAADDQKGTNHVAAVLEELASGGRVTTPRTKPYGCGVKYAATAAVGFLAPAFQLPDLDGNTVDLQAYRGSLVVLEWFNPECPVVNAAHDENGALHDAAARAREKGVVWLAVNSGGRGKQGAGVDANRRGVENFGLSHPVLLDESGAVGKAYGARTTPYMVILDQRGVIAYLGAHDDQGSTRYVDLALQELLAGKPVTSSQTKSYGCSVKYSP